MTKQEAVANHRKMWNWIADQIEERKQAINIEELKRRYTQDVYGKTISMDCFCCEYDDEHDGYSCSHCPVVWPNRTCDLLYYVCSKSADYEDQAMIKRKIANLPEKSDGGNRCDQTGSD